MFLEKFTAFQCNSTIWVYYLWSILVFRNSEMSTRNISISEVFIMLLIGNRQNLSNSSKLLPNFKNKSGTLPKEHQWKKHTHTGSQRER